MSTFGEIPQDILREKVMPYTYQCQPKELMLDVRSFCSDYAIVEDMYTLHYNCAVFINDLLEFLNGGVNIHLMVSQQLQSFLQRNINARKLVLEDMHTLVTQMTHCVRQRHCRTLWGLMTPIERTRFINKYVLESDTEEEVQEIDPLEIAMEQYDFAHVNS